MYRIDVVFAQGTSWSREYAYKCKVPIPQGEDIVVPTGNYMSVGRVVRCQKALNDPDTVKLVFGPVSFKYYLESQ